MAVYYVTSGATGTGGGLSEGDSFTWSQAISTATAGDIVNVKSGNYGGISLTISNSGVSGNPITFRGYTTSPSDITSTNGSTFNYGDSVNSSIMPLLDNSNGTGTGVNITGDFIVFENIQVVNYSLGVVTSGDNNILKNIIVVDSGNQTVNNYDGFGIRLQGCTNTELVNSYVENATAEGIKISGGSSNFVRFTEVRADNATNPTDYYLFVTSTSNNTIEDCFVGRASGLSHGGHGLTCKHNAQNNTFRRCTVQYTNIEMNFEDVTGNLYEDIRMIGEGTGSSFWHTNIDFRNGANGNTVRNVYASNVYYFVTYTDDDDGFSPNPDTDAVKCGYNNTVENAIVENCDRVFQILPNINIGGSHSATCDDNKFVNCTFVNYKIIGTINTQNNGNQFINCAFQNATGSGDIIDNNGVLDPDSNPYTTNGNNWSWVNSNIDNGTVSYGQTTNPSGFIGSGTGVERFKPTSSSLLIGAGSSLGATTDYEGATRKNPPDIGAFEYISNVGGSIFGKNSQTIFLNT